MQMPRVRISVRAMMAVVLIIGAWLGWVIASANDQRDTVAAIRRAGVAVYDSQADPESWGDLSAWRRRVADRIGPDYLDHVRYVGFFDHARYVASPANRTPGYDPDELMARIGRLRGLDELHTWPLPI